MLKILLTTGGLSSVGQTGGISAYSHDLATNLSRNGFDVYVYLIKENSTVPPINVAYKFKLYNIPVLYEDEAKLVELLLKDIHELSPDVIINNDTSYIAGLWPVLRTEIVKISVMHGFSKKFTLSNFGITGKIAALNHDYVDYIVCQNTKMVTDAIDKYKISPNKVIYVPQCYRKCDSPLTLESDGKFSIIFSNGWNKRKGSAVMLGITKLLLKSNITFTLRWCMLSKKIPSLSDSRVQTFGRLNREEFLRKLSQSDIIVIPTKLDTGPMLLVEALANGVVPVCNNLKNSAIPDHIINNFNGFVVHRNNPTEYFKIVDNLYQNRELLQQTKLNAQQYYLENLTEKHQIIYYKKLFVKQVVRPAEKFENKHVIFYHLKSTSHLSLFSWRRIYLKIRYTLEKPLTKK